MLQVLADDVVHGAAGEGQQGQLPRGQADEHLGMILISNIIGRTERLRETRVWREIHTTFHYKGLICPSSKIST